MDIGYAQWHGVQVMTTQKKKIKAGCLLRVPDFFFYHWTPSTQPWAFDSNYIKVQKKKKIEKIDQIFILDN